MGVRTSASISLVSFEKTSFEGHKKISNERMNKEFVSALSFSSTVYTKSQLPLLAVGCRSGLLQVFSNNGSLTNTLNFDEYRNEIYYKQSICQLIRTPKTNEMIAIFNDSSMIKYDIALKTASETFFEKLKEFTSSITFGKQSNQQIGRVRSTMVQGGYMKSENPEQSVIFAVNKELNNPLCYYKFNTQTIADAAVVTNPRFRNSFLESSQGKSDTVLALVNYSGFLIVFDYETMEPQFSLKSFFGGYNSLSFSPDCAYIALAGHDDCITILNTDNLNTVRCIGHKSFVSRAIFQTIPFNENDTSDDAVRESFKKSNYLRVVGAGMDGMLSFYEIEKSIFEGSARPISRRHLDLRQVQETLEFKPLYAEKFSEAIGWVDISDNLLVTCTMDGAISTHQIRSISQSKELINSKERTKDDNEEGEENRSHEERKMQSSKFSSGPNYLRNQTPKSLSSMKPGTEERGNNDTNNTSSVSSNKIESTSQRA